MINIKVGETTELRIYDGGPFDVRQFEPAYTNALMDLAQEAFPGENPEIIVVKDFLGHELHASLWTHKSLIGAASRQTTQFEWREQRLKALYMCSAAIFRRWQGWGMSCHFYGPIFDKVQPDMVATTTKAAAIYFQMYKLSRDMGLILSCTKDGKILHNAFELGQMILEKTERNAGQLDFQLVRRGYLPYAGEIDRFDLFDSLSINPQDGVLLIAAKPEVWNLKEV
ncbi:hypothetical protein A2962_01905 [Candidatus Woesebacteria bacterium RIFCSPLOWO2_01_FULL_39_61]|uniref:Uncharacterized protein n=1 Tax=Candidatus Woesebacteria bacterium RIFCSPHIGHO2_02_FULL_39_13 TaxID=1802505 RepID=A0A1F7Z0Z4_9BACT|nr:MAG: hypothetical protein A2692_02625 [Candidatus Woesebacteria bacterium RIFCSPHIGHO2_01_FULL_39_95]OGM33263.1 MAG: hypothetical protein A3D01_00545 [Candidatus Woesebacteria bacterium RIFCSPHIGHO2_02_FULL_39_13]OGM38435.1 MAG: hypothetical protein A3E13_00425 [Candidatus Woesebacteria bacterium RIFCSPHIGHO2_12_FULL_40_20]OGM66873.1 MAG: hypothetical protein A2962_01905 [Candidatus Woesebacteria bacterium RIFCSPLOWO2_01_FULL_39_61]OGM75313.1 MAG: hypothetical protein A3H19_02805 [Candidatus